MRYMYVVLGFFLLSCPHARSTHHDETKNNAHSNSWLIGLMTGYTLKTEHTTPYSYSKLNTDKEKQKQKDISSKISTILRNAKNNKS